nr:TrkH family potassium uptake protein [Paenibacillus timonensis]
MPKRKKTALSSAKILTFGFAMVITLGAFLLSLAPATAEGHRLDLIDAFFTATSAACVTGLAVVDTGTHFTVFGQIVVLLLVQIGGLGFTTVGTLISLAFNRRISLRERLVLQESLNHHQIGGLMPLILRVMAYSLTIEAAGALLLFARFARDMPLGQALYFGIFHSISIFNNGGFDLFGRIHGPFSGLAEYAGDPFVNLVVMLLIFLGGIGFIVIADLLGYKQNRRLSLHTKVVLTMSGILTVVGAVILLLIEANNPHTLGPMNWMDRIFASLFHSVSSRSGGVSTVSVADMEQSSQFLLILLMFIGAAPGSTGGGIKVTVFAILLGAIYAMMRGKQDIVFFRQRLPKASIIKAITQTWLAMFLVISVAMALSALEDVTFLNLLFETTSAFATAGLSLDVTPKLTEISKVLLCAVMFLGRIGPLTLAYAFTSRSKKELLKYPEGKIIIG